MSIRNPKITEVNNNLKSTLSADGRLIFPGCFIDLIQGEHRSVLAHQFLADATAATHAESAFHAVFKAHDDVVVGVAQFFEHRLGELDHDGGRKRWHRYRRLPGVPFAP